MTTYAFIDASNLFYGGEKSLGFKIDYQKLKNYFKSKYQAERFLYFGGVEIYDFPFDYLKNEGIPITSLKKHLENLLKTKGKKIDEARLLLLERHLQRVKFYGNLEKFGYELHLKPVKLYHQEDGTTKRQGHTKYPCHV